MKNNLQTIDIDSVDSLETYIFQLGVLCVSIQTLCALQEKAESIGIFDDDETEASKTLRYQASKLFTCANDILAMTCKRANVEWSDLKRSVIQKNTKKKTVKPKKKK